MIDNRLQKLAAQQAEAAALRHKLEKSLALVHLVPGIFDAGPASVQCIGNVRQKNVRFRVRSGDGTETVLPLHKVPTILWPATLVADIRQYGPRGPYYKAVKS